MAPGYPAEYYAGAYDLATATPVSVTLGITTSDIDFELAFGASITGHVQAANGAITPLPEALVGAELVGGGWSSSAFAGADGLYVIDELVSGDYGVWAGYGSYLAAHTQSPITVQQPEAAGNVDFALTTQYFPLRVGDSWQYVWSNDQHHPDQLSERIAVSDKEDGTYILGAQNSDANGEFRLLADGEGME